MHLQALLRMTGGRNGSHHTSETPETYMGRHAVGTANAAPLKAAVHASESGNYQF